MVDLRRIRDRSVRGMRICWQVAVLDDSYDYLSARYARNVGAGPLAALPLFRFLAGLQTAATLSHLWIYFSYDGRVIRVNASTILTLLSGSLTCERLRMHARLQAYALRRRDYVYLSRITHRVCKLSDPHSQR